MAYNDRATLRSSARTRADQDSSTFPTDAQYNDFLDQAGREVWFDLVAAGWPADFSSTTINTSGAATYQIASGAPVLSVRAVWYLQANQFYEVRRANPGKEAQLRSLQGQANYASFYEIRQSATQGTVIELFPIQSSGTYRVDYVPEFAGFANDGALWLGPPRSEELLVLKAAAKGARKEQNEDVARSLDAEYRDLFTKVTAAASRLDGRNAGQIRDAISPSPRNAFDYNVGGPGWGFGDW